MFKSKGFTIAFSILSLIAAALLVVFFYLLFGKGADALIQGVLISPIETEETTEEDLTEDVKYTIRALTPEEPHVYPVVGEAIPEAGLLTIIKAGKDNEGITFHKLPKFDASDAPGNIVHKSGSFEVVSKIFVDEEGGAYPMYRIADGYYITSNPNFVSYKADETVLPPDLSKKATYGHSGTSGILVRILTEDGNHVAFSISTFSGDVRTPVLDNVIAKYDAFGAAHFEFWNQSEAVEGSLLFIKKADSKYSITVKFDSPVLIGGQYMTEFTVE